jgi:general secretion pathway protein G
MTLIEILIVVMIIASVGTLAVTSVMKQYNKAKYNQAKILLSEVGKALDQFYTDCGFYPLTDQGLNALISAPGGSRSCPNWGPDAYTKKMPRDPWGGELIYSSDDGAKYNLKSLGADRKEGGDGFNKDLDSEEQ